MKHTLRIGVTEGHPGVSDQDSHTLPNEVQIDADPFLQLTLLQRFTGNNTFPAVCDQYHEAIALPNRRKAKSINVFEQALSQGAMRFRSPRGCIGAAGLNTTPFPHIRAPPAEAILSVTTILPCIISNIRKALSTPMPYLSREQACPSATRVGVRRPALFDNLHIRKAGVPFIAAHPECIDTPVRR